MDFKNDNSDLAAQIAKAYQGSPPAHIIRCKSPLSAFLTKTVFLEIIDGKIPDYRVSQDGGGLSVLVRCFLHTAWKTAAPDFRKCLEESVKAQSKLRAEQGSFEGANAVSSEVADRVWETVEALLSDPDLYGFSSSVGKELSARALIWSEHPEQSIFGEYIGSAPGDFVHTTRRFPQLEGVVDIRSLFNVGTYGPQHGESPGYRPKDLFTKFHWLLGTYEKQGAFWQRVRNNDETAAKADQQVHVIGGCFFPHANFCWVGDAPEKLFLDDKKRPHNLGGPAIKYEDGWQIYAAEGMRFPGALFEAEHDLLDVLGENNPQIQRTMIHNYGVRRFLKDTKASIVHSDDYGKLWKTVSPIQFISDRALKSGRTGFTYVGIGDAYRFDGFAFVEVINSTADSDGTFSDHFLRVPLDVQTAREAVAWTFGKSADDYALGVET